jgi:hypothetical protein
MFQVVFVLFAVVTASINLAISPNNRNSQAAIARTYLLHLLLIYVGLMGLLTAYAHVFRPVEPLPPSAGRQARTNMKSAWPISPSAS